MAAASSEPQLFNRQAQLRYNKALQIVQSLSSDSFQPTKNQKLKLYALYKQVTQGDVNTSRPGMFDVVGRAKWDAWKDLQGIGRVEAQHQYVETLLQAAKEAYTSHPASKAKAQEILQALASVRPMEDDDTTTTATTTTDDDDVSLSEDDDDDDRQQVDAEEQAYLKDIQEHAGRSTPSTVYGKQQQQQPPSSEANSRTTRALPNTTMIPHGQYRPPRPSSSMSNRSNRSATLKPAYVASSPVPIPSISSNSHRSGTGGGAARAVAAAVGAAMSSLQPGSAATPPPPPTRVTTTLGGANATAMSANARRSPLFDEPFDQHVNPWANQAPMPVPPNAQQPQQPLSLSSSTTTLSPLDRRILQQQHHHAATSTASSSPILGSTRLRTLQSPLQHHPPSMTQPGSSNSSTITATTANVRSMSASYYRQQQATPTPASVQQQQQQPPSRAQMNDYAYASVVSLGPATRRALESLQAEIIALNERVDDIRHEVLRRNQLQGTEARWPVAPPAEGDGPDDWEGWKWVIKAALKHAAVNLLTMLLVLWILHKRGSPAAVAVVGHFAKVWQKVRTHFRLITVIV